MYRSFILISAVFILSLLVLNGCGAAAAETNPERLVPAGADFIAKIQVARIFQDVDSEGLYQSLPLTNDNPSTLNEALERAFEKTGVDFREFSNVVIFGDKSNASGYFAVIGRGKFDEQRLVDGVKGSSDSSLATTEYKERRIHTSQKDNPISLSVLGQDTLVVGSAQAVRDVIDVQKGDQPGVSGKALDAFNSLGDPLLRIALEVPKEVSDSNSDLFQEIPSFPSSESIQQMFGGGQLFSKLEVIGISFDKTHDRLEFQANLIFDSSDAAIEFKSVMDGYLAIIKGFSNEGKTSQLIERLTLQIDHNTLELTFQAPTADLEEALGSLKDGQIRLTGG